MAFSNIGSVEHLVSGSNASDTYTTTIPNLAANSIGWVFVLIAPFTSTVSSVTWGGQSMSLGIAADSGSEIAEIWYLADPPDNGSQNIVVTWGATTAKAGAVHVCYADAGAAVTLDDTSSATGTTQNPTITSTQAGANELVVSGCTSQANALGTPVVDVTELQSEDHGGNCTSSGYSIPSSSGDATHTHNFSTSSIYAIVSASFKEAGGATATRGRLSFAEFEVPLKATRGRVSFTELEVPLVATRGRVSFAELEVPIVPTRGRLSFTEFEVPTVGVESTRGRLSWAEMEVPLVGTRGRVSWAELEVPFVPTRGRLSFAEFETPLGATRGRLSFSELEVPSLATRGRVSWMEFSTPELGEITTRFKRHIMGRRGYVRRGERG